MPSGSETPRPPDLGIDAKLRAAFELSPTILAITTAGDGRFVDVNAAFARLHGYSRDEVIGRTVGELELWVDPRQRQEALAVLQSGAAVRSFEARMRTKDGSERVCLLNADLVVIDGRTCVMTALTDITDRVRAEQALRESEQRFLLAFHANPLPMSITRLSDGVHLEVNEAAARHSGFTREEMLGRTKAELGLWVTPEQRAEVVDQLETRGRVRDFEVIFRTRDGTQRHLLVNSQVMTFAGVPAVLSVSLDITERKQYETESQARREQAERLAESLRQADRAKNEFLAMLSHELRNPLGIITNALAVLEQAPGRGERERQAMAVVHRQAAQLARLIDDLLDVARLTAGRVRLALEPVDLLAVGRRCVQALAESGRAAGHHLALEGEPVLAAGDAARLEQVVGNLLDNALKYTPAGGRITVRTARELDAAVIAVRDSGQGIPPDLLPRVFDPFVQEPQALDRARGGLGLGLAVVKRLVDLHGGSVSVESAGPGRGSEFTVRLKLAAPPAAAGAAVPRGAAPARRVLVVEDNADARDMLQRVLELTGHIVETSADGPTGLAKLREFRPDIALVDIGLPGFDGYTLARMAREHPETRDVRLVAVTGYGQAEDRARALAAGFDRYLLKPLDPGALRALIDRL
jgi:PAS domain S-box-containing protein